MARPPVTQMLAVGEPQKGNMPSRLQNRMNRNSVHKNGMYLSASCSPRLGRAISLRTKVSSDSNMFQNQPLGRSPFAGLRANGM